MFQRVSDRRSAKGINLLLIETRGGDRDIQGEGRGGEENWRKVGKRDTSMEARSLLTRRLVRDTIIEDR